MLRNVYTLFRFGCGVEDIAPKCGCLRSKMGRGCRWCRQKVRGGPTRDPRPRDSAQPPLKVFLTGSLILQNPEQDQGSVEPLKGDVY